MSASVFPALPGTVLLRRSPSYKTTRHEAASGKEDATSWQSAPKYRWDLQLNVLRESVAAPAPWAGYSEAGIVAYFFDTMQGSGETFHIVDPFDGVTDRVVRFDEDSFDMVWECAGIWSATFTLVSAL